MDPQGISVIICTYNGKDNLKETLAHLANQKVPSNIPYELILADNASTDGTIDFAKAEWDKHQKTDVSFRIIEETQPGKYYALQKAIKSAKYEFLIICDDDNWLDENYIKLAYNRISNNKEIAAVGGFGIPETKGISLPDWFKDYESAYAVGAQAESSGFLLPGKYLWGAGLVTRKSLYLKMYEHFPTCLLEAKELSVLSAEDTEYCLRLMLKGYKLYYDEALVYYHSILEDRLTKNYLNKVLSNFAKANVILRKYHIALRIKIKTNNQPFKTFLRLNIAFYRAFFSSNRIKKASAKDTLYYLLPVQLFKVDNATKYVKRFYKR